MLIQSKEKAIELIYNAIPLSNQITNLQLNKGNEIIIFEWRNHRFKLDLSSCSVHEIDNQVIEHNSVSILLEELLKQKLNKI